MIKTMNYSLGFIYFFTTDYSLIIDYLCDEFPYTTFHVLKISNKSNSFACQTYLNYFQYR